MDLPSEPEYCHTSVLPDEVLRFLGGALTLAGNETGEDELFVDATLGEGGHSELFLRRFPKLNGIGIDADSAIMDKARRRLAQFGKRMVFHPGWADDFFQLYPVGDNANNGINDSEIPLPGIILLDLGVSLFHYERGDRGFSFRKNESLDMRIDTGRGKSAAVLLAELDEAALARLLFENAEERYARRIARALCAARKNAPVTTSQALAEIVRDAVPAPARRGKIHPATKTFQALRIAANRELERLPNLIDSAFKILKTGGRLGVITFHSLEDRIVKNYFRELAKDCICPPSQPICICRGRRLARLVTPKPVSPSKSELEHNPPSRSAKLRVVEKVA